MLYPIPCQSAFCGKAECPATCPHLPALNAWKAEDAAREGKKAAAFAPQTLVRVNAPFRMNGNFAADGHEGIYTVLGTQGRDVLLAPGDVREMNLLETDWELAVRASRLTPIG